MKNTWRHFLRRFALASAVCGSMAWSSAMCYAVQLAFDSADDPVYASGWNEGQNGGFGFGPWNFDGTSVNLVYDTQESHEVDNGLKSGTSGSSPFNDIGKAWTIYNFNGKSKLPDNPPTGGTDIARAGRSFSPLQPSQTLSVIIDNPTQQAFFRGYFVRLNGGGGSICYGGAACTPGTSPVGRFGIGTFEYFTYGQWFMTDAPSVPLFDTDYAGQVGTDSGMRLDFTLTGADTFEATMTPLDNPAAAFTHSGPLGNPGVPIDWIEFTFFNTDSDFYPTMVPADARATDFYIRSIEITAAAPPGLPGDFNKDGKVDAADYAMWRKDNSVGTYEEWKQNFGRMQAGFGGGAVPEPGTFALFVIGGGLTAAALRQRRRPMEVSRRLSHSVIDEEVCSE
jgi:hypothetical protein